MSANFSTSNFNLYQINSTLSKFSFNKKCKAKCPFHNTTLTIKFQNCLK